MKNTKIEYSQLSKRTAEARREGWFPALIDRMQRIYQNRTFTDPISARHWLSEIYRKNRTEEQDYTAYLGVEKEGIADQLMSWFSKYGFPIISFRGYASQSHFDEIKEHREEQGRPAVLIYAIDFNPSGKDIQRHFKDLVELVENWLVAIKERFLV